MRSPWLVRINQSPIAKPERVMMVWVARQLPSWLKPDHMTMLGMAGSLLYAVAFVTSVTSISWLWLAAIGLVLNWAGDSLDGNLARERKIERPQYGFFVDHTSDIISQVLIFMGMGLSVHVKFETGCLLLLSYWLAALLTFIRALSDRVFRISYFGIGPTEIRIGLLIHVLSLLTIGRIPIWASDVGLMSLMDVLAILIFVIVLTSFVVMAWQESRRLNALDTAPNGLEQPDSGTVATDTILALRDTSAS